MFHTGDLRSGIAKAVSERRSVLCFVRDNSELSDEWQNALLGDNKLVEHVERWAVALCILATSPEAAFLRAYVSNINECPAVIVILNGSVRRQYRPPIEITHVIKSLSSYFDATNPTPTRVDGMRADSAALDAEPASTSHIRSSSSARRQRDTRVSTQSRADDPPLGTLLGTSEAPPTMLQSDSNATDHSSGPSAPETEDPRPNITSSSNLPRVRESLATPQDSGLATASSNLAAETQITSQRPSSETCTSPAPGSESTTSQTQQSQRDDYIKMQKEREKRQRKERERIKQQIKSDREERRRRDELHKKQQTDEYQQGPSLSNVPKSPEIRVQVRMLDGSTIRQSFTPSSTITAAIRPWIDSSTNGITPYNLKLILTPQPNRNIEAAEEELALSELGIQGSCTFVMVPVKGYVDVYNGSMAGGVVSSAASLGYNFVTGTAGALVGGVRSVLGFGDQTTPANETDAETANEENTENTPRSAVRIRTLADQRAEEARKNNQQFYNGNQLNFQPRKEEGKED